MNEKLNSFSSFDRKFFEADDDFTLIGKGSIGGKAKGLAFIRKFLRENEKEFKNFTVNIPRLTVITTDFFDEFMQMNNLYDLALSDESDTMIAHKFMKASLPVNLVGDLRSIVEKVKQPLAVRSSSMLEDALYEPFAGIYSTKMISNNQLDLPSRFNRLVEAIKLIYASTFFKKAKDYIKGIGKSSFDEKMAIIIQEVVGGRFHNRFYPEISGVARSYNYYTFGKSKPEDGVVNLALGLGKTIVDGGVSWTYCPSYPKNPPPFTSVKELINNTQRTFWAVNMEKAVLYDPINEVEYMVKCGISEAEYDGTLNLIASTYDAASDRIKPGTGIKGARIINFAPILELNYINLNEIIKKLLVISENSLGTPVEIEFAVTLKKENNLAPRLGFLQVRPMVVSKEVVELTEEDINNENLLCYSKRVLGNGIIDYIDEIVFIKPDKFDIKYSQRIADEIEKINKSLQEQKKKYLLIGYGRWGSTDPWLGIPVEWGQISNAKVIIEAMLSSFNVELSQGSHFFHNINSFEVLYFSLKPDEAEKIDWEWLNSNITLSEYEYTKHIKLKKPLLIKVDGRKAEGVIIK
ncbi:MAG: PEP/pyruvate-binding domain-containing protein [Ignavibacteria bacterium]|nr:PEP/pyruvate-binding domain-containing protein [Ignavibacteria bacterium]